MPRILIVEDEPAIADPLVYALSTEGYDCLCVGLGRIIGLELGADDYVPKPFSPREVTSRVRAILRRAGRATSAPTTEATGASATTAPPSFTHDTEGARIAYHGHWLALTRYEYRLLAVLLEKPGRVFSRSRLMEIVWHEAEETLERTVDAQLLRNRCEQRHDDERDPCR